MRNTYKRPDKSSAAMLDLNPANGAATKGS